jgi:hypothetical protein
MDHGRILKEISENKPDGRRGIGRPGLRWFENVGKHLRGQNLKYCDRMESVGKNWGL